MAKMVRMNEVTPAVGTLEEVERLRKVRLVEEEVGLIVGVEQVWVGF